MSKFLADPTLGLVRSARPGQLRMAAHVAHLAKNGGIGVIQAGTGTGKSLGALVPIYESDVKRVIYSTGKKNLQAQVMGDLPRLSSIVKQKFFAKRLGKGNYACRVRVEEFEEGPASRFDSDQVERFYRWFGTSDHDEMADFGETIPFDYLVRVQECLKHQCPHRKECGYLTSVEDSKNAEILVVNHALLAYDLAAGGGKVLGEYDMLIIDEAHQAPEAFRNAYTLRWHPAQARSLEHGMRVDSRLRFPQALHELYRDIGEHLGSRDPGKFKVLSTNAEPLIEELQTELGLVRDQFIDAGLWSEPGDEQLGDDGTGNVLSVEEARDRARTRTVATQVGRLLQLTKVLLASPDTVYDPATGDALAPSAEGIEYLTYTSRLGGRDDGTEMLVTPVEIGPLVSPALRSIGKVVLTSATLATGTNLENCFDYTLRQFGLGPSQIAVKDIVASPFNYATCAGLYIDRSAPVRPNDKQGKEEWFADIGARIHEFLEASRGGAFILCSSREDMDGFANVLRTYDTTAYRLGMQERSDDGSLAWFKEDKTSVLLGMKSLWEGVDVPGMGLRMVIVPRLPFPNMGDVLLGARKEKYTNKLRRQGMQESKIGYQTFTAFDVNIAAQELAQGFGRLIRRETDMGLGVCFDERLATKPYAGLLRTSIPIPVIPASANLSADKERALNLARMYAKIAMKK